MMPANSPNRKRQSGRGSHASATRSGVNAMGASQGSPKVGNIRLGKTRIKSTAVSSASRKLSRDAGRFFIHLVRHVGAADQRTAEYHLEPDGKAILAIGGELRRRHVGYHRQISARRLQILADRRHVDTHIAEIAQ